MAIEALAATGLLPSGSSAGAAAPQTVRAGPGASLAERASFAGALDRATLAGAVPGQIPVGPAVKGMMTALEQVNRQARDVSAFASAVTADGREMTPGEIISLTMRCQEFMFHCQLSSNIANRTSDGLQQLFRQQA
jgi:hypothetical protein